MSVSSQLCLMGGTIYTPYEEIHKGAILCEGDRIKTVFSKEAVGSIPSCSRIDLSGMMICPGFIDIHLHGALGIDFLDADEEDLDRILHFHTMQGTTSIVPTLMSAPFNKMLQAVQKISDWQVAEKLKERVCGIHLEGPFLNPDQTGIHVKDHIIPPDKHALLDLIAASRGKIVLMTMAPEMEGAQDVIPLAVEKGIIVSAGHSDALYEEMQKAMALGVSHVCHFYNAMGNFHHREPGVIGAVLNASGLTAEIICDGFHVHPVAVQLLIRLFGFERIILITDCSPLAGLGEGIFIKGHKGQKEIWIRLDGDHPVKVDMRQYHDGQVTDASGRLAGSSLSIVQAIKNCLNFGLVSLKEAIAMATVNPARLLCLDHEIGQIKPGCKANITILDRNFKTRMIIVRSQVVWTDRPMEGIS